MKRSISFTKFAERQLSKSFKGVVLNTEQVKELIYLGQESDNVMSGYADFCCTIAIENKNEHGFLFDIKNLTVSKEFAKENNALFHTSYETRNDKELPILVEFATNIKAPIAPWIHLILYNKEQLQKENEVINNDWGIVSVTSSLSCQIEPMKPITMMRNALGVKEGGSGVAICRKKYQESVNFWQEHINIRI